MKKFIYTNFVFLAVSILAPLAHAEAPAWTVDTPHSGVHFDIQHIYSTVRGSFDEFDAVIHFDPADLAGSRFDFAVAVKSVNTNNAERDLHLLSAEFFDEENYPKMTFKSAVIKHLEANRYTVSGTMMIKDVSQDVTVPFTYFGGKPNPFNPKQWVAGFEAYMTIDRLSYHVGDGKFFNMGVVGKEAKILISVEATRDK